MSIEAALKHQGVAIGRVLLIEDLLGAGHLVAPLEQRIKSPTQYYLVYPKELANYPGMQVVIRWLHAQAKST